MQVNGVSKPFPECWLFFGCRSRQEDFLYAEEIQAMLTSGVISHLVTSFSRENGKEKELKLSAYIQNRVSEFGSDIMRLMKNSSTVMLICGYSISVLLPRIKIDDANCVMWFRKQAFLSELQNILLQLLEVEQPSSSVKRNRKRFDSIWSCLQRLFDCKVHTLDLWKSSERFRVEAWG